MLSMQVLELIYTNAQDILDLHLSEAESHNLLVKAVIKPLPCGGRRNEK